MLVLRRFYLLLILAGLFFVVVQALITNNNRPLLSSSSLSTSSLVSKKYQPLLFASFEAVQKEEEVLVDGNNINNKNKNSLDDGIAVSDVHGQPLYQLVGQDLSSAWINLVRRTKVSATIELPFPITKTVRDADDDINENNTNEEDGGEEKNSIRVEYGVRMIPIQYNEDASTTIVQKEDTENYKSSSSLSSKKSVWVLEEYVQQLAGRVGKETNIIHPIIRAMNTTLTQIQLQSKNRENANINVSKRVGNFVAQLQLIRTLRPPPSKELLEVPHSHDTTICTSTPPLYDPATDSFVTGPLRLQLRPLVCQLGVDGDSDGVHGDDGHGQPQQHLSSTTTTTTTPWDVYHNVSPIDRRGHFLLLPTLSMSNKKNWRAQSLTQNDCSDLVRLASSIEPVGSLFLGYNSIGAGASQNHIHCHAWPYPLSTTTTTGSTALVSNNDNKSTSNSGVNSNSDDHSHDHSHDHDHNHECTHPDHDHGAPQNNNNNNNNNKYYDGNYAVTKVDSIYDYYDVLKRRSSGGDGDGDGTEHEAENDIAVEVSYLNYPVFCVLLSSTVDNLETLGKAIDNCLQTIASVSAAPHNVGLLNRVVDIDVGECITYVDAYIFVRSKEQSTTFLPTMKLGISEMMGVFQAQSEEELHRMTQTTSMVEFVMDDDDGTTRIERTNKSIMEQALLDVSFGSSGRDHVREDDDRNDDDTNNNAEDDDENRNDLWEKIVTNLAAMS